MRRLDDSGAGVFHHLNDKGQANMVNVSEKPPLRRCAIAQGKILFGDVGLLSRILDSSPKMKKGDILTVSKVAGIMGAKMTSKLIPLCHQITLDHVEVDIRASEDECALIVEVTSEATHRTGVEMESLTAVSVTLLTIYDMCKSADKSMVISDIKLVSKMKERRT